MSIVRRKGKPWNPAAPVHDRRSNDLLRNAKVGAIEIDCPIEKGAKIYVMRSLNDDPLARLHHRKHISESQFQGGRAFQKDFELAGNGPKAIDPTREAVDGGMMPEPITQSRQEAAQRLNSVQRELGAQGAVLVFQVLVNGLTLDQVAGIRGLKGERWRRYFAARFRECLDSLAVSYGLAMRGN